LWEGIGGSQETIWHRNSYATWKIGTMTFPKASRYAYRMDFLPGKGHRSTNQFLAFPILFSYSLCVGARRCTQNATDATDATAVQDTASALQGDRLTLQMCESYALVSLMLREDTPTTVLLHHNKSQPVGSWRVWWCMTLLHLWWPCTSSVSLITKFFELSHKYRTSIASIRMTMQASIDT
jgi:hypothetical protein